jgi:glycosyltransferase involved in cell wall biosynthesis
MRDLRRAGIPYVLTGHGQLSFQTPARWLKKFVYLNGVNPGPRRAAGLHVLTQIVGARIKYLVPGYAGPILVQGNLVAPPDFAALPPVTRADFGLPPEAFILLYLGRLDVWVKGLDFVVEAVSCLPPGLLRLVFAGPDWQGGKAALEKLANQLGCRDRLHFIEPVYGDRKWALLRLADIFISPSRKEAFSVAVAEAMAAGRPVITSTAINLAPELREHDAALLVRPAREPLAKAIGVLQADEQLREGLGARAATWVAGNCHPDRAGTRFLDFYRSLLDKRVKTIKRVKQSNEARLGKEG